MVGSYLRILKNKNFFLLWLGQVISQFGDRLAQIALIGLVYNRLGISFLGLAKIMFFTVLPVFLISPVAGVYVDRWDKRNVMMVTDFIRGVLILALGLFFVHFINFTPVYIAIFFCFCLGRFFIPAKMALVPLLVKEEDLFMANSLVSITANIAAILGFGVGGLIVEWWKPKGAFILDGVTFFLSSLLIFFITKKIAGTFKPHDLVEIGKDVVKKEQSLFREFIEGLHYLVSGESAFFSVRSFSVLFSFLGALYVVFIGFIQKTLGTGTKDLGFLAVWLTLGLFLGSLAYGRVAHKFSLAKTINVMLMLSSALLIAFVSIIKRTPSGALASFFSFVLGFMASPIVIACNSLIHKRSSDNLWGRIFSSLEVVAHFAFILFMFITSILADKLRVPPFVIIIWVGIVVIIFSLISLFRKEEPLN